MEILHTIIEFSINTQYNITKKFADKDHAHLFLLQRQLLLSLEMVVQIISGKQIWQTGLENHWMFQQEKRMNKYQDGSSTKIPDPEQRNCKLESV